MNVCVARDTENLVLCSNGLCDCHYNCFRVCVCVCEVRQHDLCQALAVLWLHFGGFPLKRPPCTHVYTHTPNYVHVCEKGGGVLHKNMYINFRLNRNKND